MESTASGRRQTSIVAVSITCRAKWGSFWLALKGVLRLRSVYLRMRCLELCESLVRSRLIRTSSTLKEKDETHQTARRPRRRKKTKVPQLRDPYAERNAVADRAINAVVCAGSVRGHQDAGLES